MTSNRPTRKFSIGYTTGTALNNKNMPALPGEERAWRRVCPCGQGFKTRSRRAKYCYECRGIKVRHPAAWNKLRAEWIAKGLMKEK